MANPEAPKNPESPESKEDLNGLKLDISNKSKDYKKFESLSKDSVLKNGLEKILKKGLESKINTFEKNHNKYTHESIDYYTAGMIKSHPELINFIVGELNLPIRTDNSKHKFIFSELSFQQKLNFMALMDVFWDYKGDGYKKAKTSDIIDKYWKYIDNYTKETTENFNREIDKNKNIVGLVKLEKILKSTYGLTDTEFIKFKEYLELIQKHPEYMSKLGLSENFKLKGQHIEAGIFSLPQFWTAVKRLIIAGLTIWGVSEFKSCTSLQPERAETRVYGDHSEITNFKESFKVMSAVTTTDSSEREFKENGFDHVHTGSDILKPAEWLINKGVDLGNRTGIANRDLTLRIKCDNYHVFDFENMRCFVEKKDGVRVVRVTGVKKPEIITNVTNVEVLESHREIIHRKKFDDFDFKAQEVLKKEANETANSPEQIKKAEEILAKHILSVFQSTGCCNSDIAVKGNDIQGIILEFEDNEHPRYVNIEDRGKHINN